MIAIDNHILSGSYILAAEDDADDQALIQSAFEECAFPLPCYFVDDGSQVVNHLQTDGIALPTLVMLDINMPVMTGIDVLQFMKKNEKFRHLPVIMLSTADVEPIKTHCLALGASRYIEKPNDFQTLVRV